MADGYINQTAATDNAQGVVVASNSGDHVAADPNTGSQLSATGGDNVFMGGAGNDGFVIQASALAHSTGTTDNGIAADTAVFSFGGAGGWSASNNDFLALTGFGAGSTLTFDHYGNPPGGGVDTVSQFYTLHDSTTGNDYTLFIRSTDGQKLVAGDYHFF